MGFRFPMHNLLFWMQIASLPKISNTVNGKNDITVSEWIEKVPEFLRFGLPIDSEEYESLALVTGEKERRFMNKQIHYSDEPIGEIRFVPDFLPSPDELVLKNEQKKVTISLSVESVDFFKEAAKKHNMQYQRMIMQLLDEYVAIQKHANKEM
ncbi:helix-turn-helix protein CopG [Candidatus Symbiobacter mobilis CR]|uniref:Helix-turn-helix protein CopG n=2 Tax=Candidatus Symbiobacter TaxID=1436289 RepID=U5N4K1_9BURK|nr:helix-turn-helix protein CopG [Candidatus Symbiobacter mobilis CR]